MRIHTWQNLSILVLLVCVASSTALGDSDAPGVTDFSGANAGAIEMSDITSALLSPEGRDLLDKVGAALSSDELATFRFSVEGHTDSVGSEAYNDSLSAQRAAAVKEYLVAQGVPPERIATLGRGESDPVADNDSDVGRQRNRRVELINLGGVE
jgi:flagellar motor protein MotB